MHDAKRSRASGVCIDISRLSGKLFSIMQHKFACGYAYCDISIVVALSIKVNAMGIAKNSGV
jgi:hypothetical protein